MRRPCAQSILLVTLLLVGTIAWTTEAFGQPRLAVPIHPDVRASIQRHGAARVIVELRTPRGAHVPEGDLAGASSVVAQRRDIASARLPMLGALLATGHRVVRHFTTVPFVALEIGDDALRALEASVFDVARVVEDTVGIPHLATSGPLVQADQAWARGFDGTGMTVAVLDMGVDDDAVRSRGRRAVRGVRLSARHACRGHRGR
jgi:hypothetical protein